MHSNVKVFKCERCEFLTKTSSSIKVHKLSPIGENPLNVKNATTNDTLVVISRFTRKETNTILQLPRKGHKTIFEMDITVDHLIVYSFSSCPLNLSNLFVRIGKLGKKSKCLSINPFHQKECNPPSISIL